MTHTAKALSVPSVVRAPLKYRVKADEKPVVHITTPGADASQRDDAFEWQTVSIADGRPVVDGLLLDEAGFELRAHDTAVSNFYDDEEIQAV